MAKCRRCPTVLPGRAQLCDPCKAQRVGTAETVVDRKVKKATRGKKSKPVDDQVDTTAAPDQVASPATVVPAGLHRRGRELWADLGATAGTAAGELAIEICRAADRLEELDRIVHGKGVMQLMQFRLDHVDFDGAGDQHVHVRVGFQSVLMEARLQQASFKELLKEYRAVRAAAPPSTGGAAPASAPAAPPATGLDEFSQRRAQRGATT